MYIIMLNRSLGKFKYYVVLLIKTLDRTHPTLINYCT